VLPAACGFSAEVPEVPDGPDGLDGGLPVVPAAAPVAAAAGLWSFDVEEERSRVRRAELRREVLEVVVLVSMLGAGWTVASGTGGLGAVALGGCCAFAFGLDGSGTGAGASGAGGTGAGVT
jgi:hypothetical protein